MWSEVKNVIIPSGIGAFLHETTQNENIFGHIVVHRTGAFSDCWKLKSAKLGDGITTIAENMFHGCRYNFREINFPDSLSTIEEGAFEGCAELSLCIPETVRNIAPGAFCGAESVILPSSCVSAFEEHLATSKGTVIAVAGVDGAGCVRAGYTPSEKNLNSVIATELSSGVAFDAIDARFDDGASRRLKIISGLLLQGLLTPCMGTPSMVQ